MTIAPERRSSRDEIIKVPSGDYTISTRVKGEGPLVILMHGFPELGLSWRHQRDVLAEAGFTIAIPDMRGYGASSKPQDYRAYGLDFIADDVRAIADALGHERWVSIGHDWGANTAWRTALRFPERVAALFSLSIPYPPPPPMPVMELLDQAFPNRFFYIRYFQDIGVAEDELERDVRASLKQMFYSGSGDAPKDDWICLRPHDSPLLPGLTKPPAGPLSFMSDVVLDEFAEAFSKGGFFGPISWYRNYDTGYTQNHAYPDPVVRQPAGFLCGDKEVGLSMFPGSLDVQRRFVVDLRREIILPGAGHWIQQERPAAVNEALIDFLAEVRTLI